MLQKILEFAPAIAFFVSYQLTSDLIIATIAIVSTCVIAFALQYALTRTVSRMQVFLTAAVLLFGLPTILLHDPAIIKWKVTLVNLILAAAIGVCQYGLKRNPFHYLFGKELKLPEFIWLKLSACWMGFFIFGAALNLVIAFCLPSLFGIDEATAESLWVDYKAFGNAILNTVFAVVSMLLLFRAYPHAFDDLNLKEQTKQ